MQTLPCSLSQAQASVASVARARCELYVLRQSSIAQCFPVRFAIGCRLHAGIFVCGSTCRKASPKNFEQITPCSKYGLKSMNTKFNTTPRACCTHLTHIDNLIEKHKLPRSSTVTKYLLYIHLTSRYLICMLLNASYELIGMEILRPLNRIVMLLYVQRSF